MLGQITAGSSHGQLPSLSRCIDIFSCHRDQQSTVSTTGFLGDASDIELDVKLLKGTLPVSSVSRCSDLQSSLGSWILPEECFNKCG